MRIRTASLLLTVSALALAGCGSSTSSSSTTTSAQASAASARPAGSGSGASTSASASASVSSTTVAGQTECPPADGSAQRVTNFDAPPPMCIDPAKTYTAVMETDAGTMTIALDAAKAPQTVNNFVVLSRYHYYDGLTFHRVIPGFMAQGGDPMGTGAGGPGYEFADELPAAGEYQIGSLAMANAGPNTNGSQFFIVSGDAGVALPPAYSLFGQLTEGEDVLRTIEGDGSQSGTPTTRHIITKVTINES